MSGKHESTESVNFSLGQPDDYMSERVDGCGLKRRERSDSDRDSGSGSDRYGDRQSESHGTGKSEGDRSDSSGSSNTPELEARRRFAKQLPEQYRIAMEIISNREPDEERNEAYLNFLDQYEKGQGFDFDFAQFKYNYGFYPVIGTERWDDVLKFWDAVNECARVALDQHNKETGKKLEFVKTLKANFQAARGYLFYITLQVKDCSSSYEDTQLYQAIVGFLGFENIRVHHCRPKPPEGVVPPPLDM